MSRESLAAAKKLQLILVAGVGSDHIDLEAAAAAGLTVAECTGAPCLWCRVARVLGGLLCFPQCTKPLRGSAWSMAGHLGCEGQCHLLAGRASARLSALHRSGALAYSI